MFPGLVDLISPQLHKFLSAAEEIEYNSRAQSVLDAHKELKHQYLRSTGHWGVKNEDHKKL
jgi:hypothetical protein